ncbi:MAG: ferrous iron transport protein [Verrucomicrobiota bacterium]
MSDPSPSLKPTPTAAAKTDYLVVLTGNPNCGKTTLFNSFTGLRAKVGNYPGVTVERKEGRLRGLPPDLKVNVLDLPGTYSLSAQSPDEAISRDVLWQRRPDVAPPDLIVLVVDASNLERNLYYAIQVIELGYPVLVALNMVDVARENGIAVDAHELARQLKVPVIPMIASNGTGVAEMRDLIARLARHRSPQPATHLILPIPSPLEKERDELAALLQHSNRSIPTGVIKSEALLLLSDASATEKAHLDLPHAVRNQINAAHQRLQQAGIDWHSAAIEARYAYASTLHRKVVSEPDSHTETLSDRIDRWVTHRAWGLVIFVSLMALMFQSIFTLAQWPMEMIDAGTTALGELMTQTIPSGPLQDLVVNGMIAGVGSVLVFLPQIVLLFLFLGLLEDTGYMARGAFMMDRIMSRVGLHGKSFIPLLSSFACAIPGIMATRTIENHKDRLATILVAPLMSCSARLPVYALLIGAFVPNRKIAGFLGLQGLTLLSMYLLGIVTALGLAWLFKKSFLKGDPPLLILELPPYRRPVLKVVLRHMWDRSKLFIQRAGTVILGASIILWFLASYPANPTVTSQYEAAKAQLLEQAGNPAEPDETLSAQLAALNQTAASEQVRHSYAGSIGRLIEPLIQPLGFDWQIGVGIVGSFAAREIFVSTMATIYNASESGTDGPTPALPDVLRQQKHADGSPSFTLRTALALMVFYVYALQCVSTIAIVRRETNSWKWPVFQWAYMAALAWVAAFATYHVLPLLGVL